MYISISAHPADKFFMFLKIFKILILPEDLHVAVDSCTVQAASPGEVGLPIVVGANFDSGVRFPQVLSGATARSWKLVFEDECFRPIMLKVW